MRFQGSIVALVTPMAITGELILSEWKRLIRAHLHANTSGIVVAGSTGESQTLTESEFAELLSVAVQEVRGRIPVIAGTGTACTQTTLERSRLAKSLGADACLVVTPYYNKPSQRGLRAHYEAVACLGLPIILYNAPSRTGCNLQPETIVALSAHPQIIGLKEGSDDLERVPFLKQQCPGFTLLTGEDESCLEFMKAGGHGVVSVTANIAPRPMAQLLSACLAKEWATAERLQAQLIPLHRALFLESNPVPIKWALEAEQQISGGIRLPLLPLDPQYHPAVRSAIHALGAEHVAFWQDNHPS